MKIKYDSHTQNVLKQRYLHKGETCVEDVFRRVAKCVASVEKDPEYWEGIFYTLMAKQFALPNSPLLWSAGTDRCMPFACFVLSPEDSRESIFNTLKDTVCIQSSGGGTGHNFSKLRPKGSLVKSNGAMSSGPVSYMRVFNEAICGTKQGKRNGAMIAILEYNHPDIEEFITCKQSNDNLKGFNVSVLIDDQFMKAVLKDGVITLSHPNSDGSPNQGKVVKARDLFMKIAKNAHAHAEPGLLFYNRINKDNLREEPIIATNPCVAKGTLVNTPYGYRKVEDIKCGDLVSTLYGSESVVNIEINQNHPIHKVVFSNGLEQYVTQGHIYHVKRLGSSSKQINRLKLSDLKIGDYVQIEPIILDNLGSEEDYVLGLKAGILLGDGCYTQGVLNTGIIKIASRQDYTEYNANLMNLFGVDRFNRSDYHKSSLSMNLNLKFTKDEILGLHLFPHQYSYEKNFDICMIHTIKASIGILDGLLATDGDINLKSNHPQIRWNTTSKILADNIYRLLLQIGSIGIISQNNSTGGNINGRQIERKHTCYQITISGNSVKQYYRYSRLQQLHPKKGKLLNEARTRFLLSGNVNYSQITSIEYYGTADVYDLYCKNSDTWITSGFVQQGCGEQSLPDYACCNLMSINLSKFVNIDNHSFDFERYKEVISICIRFLDNVLDIAKFPLEKNKEIALQERRVGLGVMGFADACVLMNIRYGSEECIAFINSIAEILQESSRRTSEILGKEKGIPQYVKERCIANGIKPLRNLARNTVAPTGTLSMLAQCSGGIEPIFSLEYTRNDTTGTSLIKHDLYEKYKDDPRISKDVWVDSYQLSTQQHLIVQATWQQYIDNACSKTINMPASATVEDVYNLYIEAWKLGLKGITVYRDGSIQDQVLTKGVKEPSMSCAPRSYERPRVLPCEVHFHSVKGSKWYILLGIYNEEPYEVFAIPASFITWKPDEIGVIEKVKKGLYRFFSDSKELDITREVTNHEQAEMCRMVSVALKHRVPIDFVVEQLEKSLGEFHCMSKAIARSLKHFVRDGTKISGFICPQCGSCNIIRIGGCPACLDCSYTKCS